jgi:hypothetical protein
MSPQLVPWDYAGAKLEPEAGIPKGQWDAARRALQQGDTKGARGLLGPWLQPANGDPGLTAKRWAAWAKLLEFTAQQRAYKPRPESDQALGGQP